MNVPRPAALVLVALAFVGCSGPAPAGGPSATLAVDPALRGRESAPATHAAPAAPVRPAPDPGLTLRYKGKDRKAAKTSICDGDAQTFATIGDLLEELPADEDMLDHDPAIEKTGDHSERCEDEDRNVRVKGWLYAMKLESDNDYHLIVGDAANKPELCMNCEVSGLPASSAASYKKLKAVRAALRDLIGTDLPSDTKYHYFEPPIHVQIEGSAFYDIDHKPGVVGPVKFRSHLPSAWEIHPISSIEKAN